MVDDVQEFTLLRRSSLASGVGHLLVKTKPQAAECEGTENRVAEGVVATDLVGHHRSFDGLRIILVSMVTTCLGWTVWLLLLNIAPNNMVNRIMDTSNLESGSFWQFVDLPLPIYGLAIFGLTIIGLGYSFVLIKLIWKRAHSRVLPETGALVRIHAFSAGVVDAIRRVATDRTSSRSLSSAASLVSSLASSESIARKRLNLCMKLVDLMIELVMLLQILEDGLPIVLVAVFTVIVAANAVWCALVMLLPLKQTVLVENLIDLIFDLLIAVGYPMILVCYCLSAFKFDRAKLMINQAVFPQGWLEQSASTIADPVQTVVIYKTLNSLRISSIFNFFTRMGINITLWLKCQRLMNLMENPRRQSSSVYPRHCRLAASSLVAFAIFVIIYVEESTRTSAVACHPHPECVINARRWLMLDSLTQCPCLALIDNNIAPKTYSEWMDPKDITAKVAHLATMGLLQIVQLTNRKLEVLPEELRGCTDMRYLSLVYTHTQTFPVWIHELTQLEYLRVEGKATVGLVSLPADMFDEMSSLTTLHLSTNVLTRLPSFHGLKSLKLLALVASMALVELPPFDSLHKLERIIIVIAPLLDSLPDLSPIYDLKTFVTMDRGTWCCNGFLGKCDLQNPMCGIHPVWGVPAATCLPINRTEKIASRGTLDTITKFSMSVCGGMHFLADHQPPPIEETMASCDGILYRQCELPGSPAAICYNARFMGIACTASTYPIEMRRRQIAQGVGDPCDPEYEAWLGCK
ncbi:hypothetical protein, variant 1 [Phytophthora nicotianae CJ01A1]|uniref:WLGC domain-containing protein n=2 Tax=Phytophthora nicotianae CJ01A1 TaxID=1317063 RepID=W2WSU0_PHYNI|nr:hypothetical protein, variant 1 [Phytophthora nicotianae CJ01A1]